MVSPAAEVELDERAVRALLAAQHPDLAALPLRELDAGWDNTLWRLGDELLVRLPRRSIAAPLVLHEQRWLPIVSARLPLPTPVPVRVGRPTTDFPWSWSIVPWLEGVPADRRPPLDAQVAAAQLGGFLRALHRRAPADAPRNPYRGVPLVERANLFETRSRALASETDVVSVREVWQRALAAPRWTRAPVWLHGDLHPANTLVAGGRLAAVIDFGDVCAGDPATDLAAAWMLLPPEAVPVFAEAYAGLDADLEARALGWAALFGLMLLAIGLDDRPTYEPIGRRTLEHAIQHRAAR